VRRSGKPGTTGVADARARPERLNPGATGVRRLRDGRIMDLEVTVENPLARERARITTVFFYGFVAVLGYSLLQIFAPFLGPLGWAAVLSIFVYPWHEKLSARHGNTRAAALSTLTVTVLIVGPGLVLLTAFVQESRAALAGLDREALTGQLAVTQNLWNRVRGLVPGVVTADLGTLIHEAITRVGGFLAGRIGGLLADLVVLLFQLFVTLFALFFFLRDADTIMREMRRALPFEQMRRERMIRQTRDLVYASVAAGLLIASLQGLAGGLVFAVLGLGAAVFWGVIMAFLALLPFVGTWIVWLPAAIWLVSTGQVAKGVTLAVVGAVVVGSIDNILRPAILSGRAQMNGLLMFISLLGGVSVFGLLGLVLGPLVTAIVIGLFDANAGPGEILGGDEGLSVMQERNGERMLP
jgi:predicted PurR-regulated permease PerM